MADTRRLIGIDLAWGEGKPNKPNASGCAELVWDGDDLTLERLALRCSMDDIIEWIDPARGDWVVAVDAPLVICNEEGQRPAENQASKIYGKHHAGAHSNNLKRKHRGPQLLEALVGQCGELVERAAATGGRRLIFETYPNIAMVELFELEHTIKYKLRWVKRHYEKAEWAEQQLAGQQRLADCIRHHLCSGTANPPLRTSDDRTSDDLEQLLSDPGSGLDDDELKCREDKLDGLICAYTAAWLDAGRDLVGLGKVGEGVMIAPRVQGIGPLLL